MTKIAIIAGTGLSRLNNFNITDEKYHDTVYGQTTAPLVSGRLADREIIFLARHGSPHRIPPHKVNYRANILALKECGVDRVISINAVGGITPNMAPCMLVVPDQIIDYTSDREHSIYDGSHESLEHIDFTQPYCNDLRLDIINSSRSQKINLIDGATYGATQGPRLESAAEITRMEKDGCDVVGMTGMPETALAKELELCYASLCLVVNWAAGKSNDTISMDIIGKNLERGMKNVLHVISAYLENYYNSCSSSP
jgi:5'-deoxy-5'-methylthioadenosine phosphorylase